MSESKYYLEKLPLDVEARIKRLFDDSEVEERTKIDVAVTSQSSQVTFEEAKLTKLTPADVYLNIDVGDGTEICHLIDLKLFRNESEKVDLINNLLKFRESIDKISIITTSNLLEITMVRIIDGSAIYSLKYGPIQIFISKKVADMIISQLLAYLNNN